MKIFARTLLSAALLVCVGAGCWRSDQKPVVTEPIVNATSTARTSWSETTIPRLHLAFTPPKGYWVYWSNQTLRYYLVPTAQVSPEGPDPDAEARAKAVAHFYIVQNTEAGSFPSWERFELTMAQFDCAEGTTLETQMSCRDTVSRESQGSAGAGVTYRAFSLPFIQTKTKVVKGTRSYAFAKVGAAEQYGILFRVLDETVRSSVVDLAKSVYVEG